MTSQLEKVRASEASLLATVDNAKDAILTLSTEGTVVAVNRGAENMLGWSRQEMVGHPLGNLLTLSSLPAMEAHLTQSLTNPSAPSIIEVEFVHSNGQGLWTEGCTSAIRDTSGTATGVVAIYRDLSHRQQRSGGHITLSTPQGDTQPQRELELEPEVTASPLSSYQFSQSDQLIVSGPLTDLAPSAEALSESGPAPSFTIPLVAKSDPQQEETPSAPVQFAFVDEPESEVQASPSFPTEFPLAEERAPQQEETPSAPVQFAFVDEPESEVPVSSLVKSDPQQAETASTPVQFAFIDELETEPQNSSSTFTSFSFVDQVKSQSPGLASQPFNFSEALSNIGGDEGLLAELAGIFLEEYPELLENIRAAVVNNDSEALIYHAHALKGSVSNFIALDTEGAVRRLEQLGREGNLAGAPTVLGELETALSRLAPALSDLALQGAA
jgi:PAS domain S-box-containing protein